MSNSTLAIILALVLGGASLTISLQNRNLIAK